MSYVTYIKLLQIGALVTEVTELFHCKHVGRYACSWYDATVMLLWDQLSVDLFSRRYIVPDEAKRVIFICRPLLEEYNQLYYVITL